MAADSPNWFGRNWKWFVPVGCVTVLLLIVGVGVLLGFGAMRLYEGSGVAVPARDALAAARATPAVTAALGSPLDSDWMMKGSVQINNDRGDADVRYRIHGPRGEGWVHVVGERVDGRWQYRRMEAELPGQPAPIDLLPALPRSDPAAD